MLKKIAIFTGSAVLSKAMPFFVLPIVTRAMGSDEYGVAVLTQLAATLFLCVAGANIQTIVMRNFFSGDEIKKNRLISTAVFTVVLSHIAIYFLTIFFLNVFHGAEIFGLKTSHFTLLVSCISLFQSLNAVHMAIKRCEGQAWRFALYEITQAAIYVSALLLFIYRDFGWLAIPLALLVSFFFVAASGIVELINRQRLALRFSKEDFIEIFKVCAPQIIHLLSGTALALSDRFIIQWSIGEGSVGIYSAYYTLGMGAVILIDGVVRVWSPQAYKLLSDESKNARDEISIVTQGLVVSFFIFLAVYVSIIYFLEPYVLASEYLGFFPIFLFVVSGYFFQGLYKLMFPVFIHFSRSGMVAVINVAGATINLCLSLLLVEKYGLYGVAFATLASFIAIAVSMFFYQNSFYKLNVFGNFRMKSFINAFRE